MPHWKELYRGIRDALPVAVAASIFGMVFGTVAADRGLSFFEAMLMTATIYAGASQFSAVSFWHYPLPYFTIMMVVFAINFRHVLYGASLGRKLGNFSWGQRFLAFFFLVDPTFVLAEKRYEAGFHKADDVGLTPSYYFGTSIALYVLWVAASAIGYAFGNRIEDPKAYGLDFILPIYFLVLLLGFRHRPNWLWVVLASGAVTLLTYMTIGSPWHISAGSLAGLFVGAIIGVPRSDSVVLLADGKEKA